MYDVELFLGFPIDENFKLKLSKADPSLLSIFIQNNQNYLHEVVYNDVHYLGKFAGKINDYATLDLLSGNIYSLLKKIIPNYQYEKVPLILFPVESGQNP